MSPTATSVIIPTWNRARVLPRALDSVCNQRVAATEIIVVDDGSHDDTADLIRDRYPTVIYHRIPHRGVSAARNAGARLATGNWLAFLDSDDLWQAEKLAAQLEAAVAEPALKIFHCDEIWYRRGVRVNPMAKHAKPDGWIFPHCLPRCCVSPSTVLIDRELFLASGGFDEGLPACEDYDLWLRLFVDHPIRKIPRPLVIRYGGHADQLSARFWGMDRFRVRSLVNLLQSGRLQAANRRLVLATLQTRLEVLLNGAKKRQRKAMVAEYQALMDKWITDG